MTHKHLNLTLAFALCTLTAFAQNSAEHVQPTTQTEFVSNAVFLLVALVIIVLLIAFLVLVHHNTELIKTIYDLKEPSKDPVNAKSARRKESGAFGKLYNLFIMPPHRPDEDLMLDHDYDGIRELDNGMPPWLRWVFIVTIFVAVIYLLRYHVYSEWSSKQEYETEVSEANAAKTASLAGQKNKIDETNVVQLKDAASIAAGKAIYLQPDKCVTCHGSKGEGGTGPNLTDDSWLHGCNMTNIFNTIEYGVPAKGMPTWNGILNHEQLQQVASYVMSLQGTNPPNGKAPQGDKCIPSAPVTADAATLPDTTKKTDDPKKSKMATPGK